MIRARWRNRIGPPSMLLASALLVTAGISASAALASPTRHASLRDVLCPDTPVKAARAAQRESATRSAEATTELRVNSRGELYGRRLRLADDSTGISSIELPVESFVGERTADAIVYTRSGGGRGSEVHVVDLATGCDTIVAQPSEIVRSAIVSPDASAVYVHSVARGTRRDAGVTRHDLASGVQETVVSALAPVARVGPIHGTELRWSLGGSSLTVQSCGFAACLSRLLEVASGNVVTIDRPGQGALIGTTDKALITYSTCPGLPCAVLSHSVATGSSTVLADEVHDASLSTDALGRPRLSITTAMGQTEVSL